MMSRGMAAAVNGKAISCEGGCDRAPQRRTVLRCGKTCDEAALYSRHPPRRGTGNKGMTMDSTTRTELEAAAFRRLLDHLRARTDVQNIDLMNLAGFCRNCLSNWLKDAADAKGVPLSKDESRQAIYGMPFEEWKAKYQQEASAEQKAAFEKSSHK